MNERRQRGAPALGTGIVAFYHSEDIAREALAEWEWRFSMREDPTEIPERTITASELTDGLPFHDVEVESEEVEAV